ncbi:MAG: PilZ domain-containing protein [Candidatus Velamenicoccus archaeovorus]
MEHSYPDQERRKFRRVKQGYVLMYKMASGVKTRALPVEAAYNGMMLDLSEGGMAFLTHQKIPLSTCITNKFILVNELMTQQDNRFRPIEAEGKVCYHLCGQRGMYRVGLQFTRLSDDDRGFIKNMRNCGERKTEA